MERLQELSTQNQGLNSPTRHRVTRENVLRRDHESSHVDTDKIKAVEELVKKLEYDIKSSKAENERLRVILDTKEHDFKLKLDNLEKEKTEAAERAIYHYKRSEEAKEGLAMIKGEHTAELMRLNLKLQEQESEIGRLVRDLGDAQEARQLEEDRAKRKEAEFLDTIHGYEHTMTELQQRTLSQGEQISSGLEKEKDLVCKLAEAERRITKLEGSKFDSESLQALDNQLQRNALRALDLEKENRKLASELKHYKSIYRDVESLRNDKETLEKQVRELMPLKSDVVRLDIENTRLKKERLDWSGYLEANDGTDYETPQGIVFHLTRERESARILSGEIDRLKSELEAKDEVISKMSDHIEELAKSVSSKESAIKSSQYNVSLCEKNVEMMKKHVTLLEDQLKLYDVEESNFMSNYDTQKTERIAQLEALLKDFEEKCMSEVHEIVTKYQSSPEPKIGLAVAEGLQHFATGISLYEAIRKLSRAKMVMIQELSERDAKVNMLTKEVQAAQEQTKLFSDLIDRRELYASQTVEQIIAAIQENMPTVGEAHRVLMHKDNPASKIEQLRKSRLEHLIEENTALLQQVEELQCGGDSDAQIGKKRRADDEDAVDAQKEALIQIPQSSLRNKEEQVQLAKEELAKKEKRIQRLHQVWDAKLNEYSEAIRSLLGYSLTFLSSGKVRLESVFVDGSELAFQFKSSKGDQGTLQVLGAYKTEYMEVLKHTYDTYVMDRGSIPAFLSATTLELQERTMESTIPEDRNAYDEDDVYPRYEQEDEEYDEQSGALEEEESEYVDADELSPEQDHGEEEYIMDEDDSGEEMPDADHDPSDDEGSQGSDVICLSD